MDLDKLAAILEKSLDAHQCACAALAAAQVEREKQAAARPQLNALVKEAAAALVQHNRIGPSYRGEAEARLGDHLEALRILKAAADPKFDAAPPPQVPPALGKQANGAPPSGYRDAVNSPYVGLRDGRPTGADELWERNFGKR